MDKIEYKGNFYTVTEELKLVPVQNEDGLDNIKVGSIIESSCHGRKLMRYIIVCSKKRGGRASIVYSALILESYDKDDIGKFTECDGTGSSVWTRSLEELICKFRHNHNSERKFKLVKE